MDKELLSVEIQTKVTQTVDQLLEKKEKPKIKNIKEVKFCDVGENQRIRRFTKPISIEGKPPRMEVQKDHYNVSEPVDIQGKEVIFAREELPTTEDSEVIAHEHDVENDTWIPIDEIPPMVGCQDPSSLGEINGTKYLSVVNTKKDPDGKKRYWAELHAINGDLNNLLCIAKGPGLSKGLHLIQTGPETIEGVIRMQGGKYGKGKICHFHAKDVSEIQDILANIEEKTKIIDIFDEEEWGGINDMDMTENGEIMALGHIAREIKDDQGNVIKDDKGNPLKEYHVTLSRFNPENDTFEDYKIILSRDDIPLDVIPKRPDLEKVIYPTNAVFEGNLVHIYLSVCDVKEIVITLELS